MEPSRSWVPIVGAFLGALTLLFFMAMVVAGLYGNEVPCNSIYLVSITLSLGAALSAAFLGGSAAANGNVNFPILKDNPIAVSITGGIAVLFLMLILTSYLFQRDNCSERISLNCPIGLQEHQVDVLRFGFCYPREGWEVDSSAITLNAGDIYVRKSGNSDVGIHFHVSLVPAAWVGKADRYTVEVANTWRQLDPNITTENIFISGRSGYKFDLLVKDRLGRNRPTSISHFYIDDERLLEIISTWFNETKIGEIADIRKIMSSLTFLRA